MAGDAQLYTRIPWGLLIQTPGTHVPHIPATLSDVARHIRFGTFRGGAHIHGCATFPWQGNRHMEA